MKMLELIEGESKAVRKQKYNFPLKGCQLTMEELNTNLEVTNIFGLTNSDGKILIVIDTETGEIFI